MKIPGERSPGLTWKRVLAPCNLAGLSGATGLRVLQKWMLESRGLGVSRMGVWKRRKNSCESHCHGIPAFPMELQPFPGNSSHKTPSAARDFGNSHSLLPPAPPLPPLRPSPPSLPSLSNPPLFLFFPPNPAGSHSRAAPPPSPAPALWESGIMDLKRKKISGHTPDPGATDNASNNKRSFHPAPGYSRFTSQALPRVPKEQLRLDFNFFYPCLQPFQFSTSSSPTVSTLIPIYCRGEITQIQNDLTALLDSVLFQVFHET